MYQPAEAMHGCYACAKGQYQDKKEQTSCKKCPCHPGMFSHGFKLKGMKSQRDCDCMECDVGKFSNKLNGPSLKCKACAEDKYASNTGSIKCTSCPKGYFAGETAATGCLSDTVRKPILRLNGDATVRVPLHGIFNDPGAHCEDRSAQGKQHKRSRTVC